jgi:hypothetical protein
MRSNDPCMYEILPSSFAKITVSSGLNHHIITTLKYLSKNNLDRSEKVFECLFLL